MNTFDYQVRISNRAKRVQLRVKATGDIEVVIPKGINPAHADEFVHNNQAWIQRTQRKLAIHASTQDQPEVWPPSHIEFPAFSKNWQIKTGHQKIIHADISSLWLPDTTAEEQKNLLRNWLRVEARKLLIPQLSLLSEETGLRFKRATIRCQKTRWGSCSSKGTISLNCNLVFLPQHLIRYLMLHELAHTKHMNHSTAYWRYVETLDPNFRQHDLELSRAPQSIPHWARPV